MNIIIASSRHSHKSAKALSAALECPRFNPYKEQPDLDKDTIIYNMGCLALDKYKNNRIINDKFNVLNSIHKKHTYLILEQAGLNIPPWTERKQQAEEWLEEDHIIINRETFVGKANKGLTFSYKDAPDIEDVPLNENAEYWARNVRAVNEYRAYCFRDDFPIILKKNINLEEQMWTFSRVSNPKQKLFSEIQKAQDCFPNMTGHAFDIIECVTGDYYFLENNSAPSLLVHHAILPRLVNDITSIIQNQMP